MLKELIAFYKSATLHPDKVEAIGTRTIFFILWITIFVLAGALIAKIANRFI